MEHRHVGLPEPVEDGDSLGRERGSVGRPGEGVDHLAHRHRHLFGGVGGADQGGGTGGRRGRATGPPGLAEYGTKLDGQLVGDDIDVGIAGAADDGRHRDALGERSEELDLARPDASGQVHDEAPERPTVGVAGAHPNRGERRGIVPTARQTGGRSILPEQIDDRRRQRLGGRDGIEHGVVERGQLGERDRERVLGGGTGGDGGIGGEGAPRAQRLADMGPGDELREIVARHRSAQPVGDLGQGHERHADEAPELGRDPTAQRRAGGGRWHHDRDRRERITGLGLGDQRGEQGGGRGPERDGVEAPRHR